MALGAQAHNHLCNFIKENDMELGPENAVTMGEGDNHRQNPV